MLEQGDPTGCSGQSSRISHSSILHRKDCRGGGEAGIVDAKHVEIGLEFVS